MWNEIVKKVIAWWKALPAAVRSGAICLLIGLCLGAGIYACTVNRRVSVIAERQAEVDRNISNFGKELSDYGTSLAGVASGLASIEGDVRGIKQTVSGLAKSTGDVTSAVQRIDGDIQAIKITTGELDSRQSEFAETLAKVESTSSGLNEGFIELGNGLIKLEGKIQSVIDGLPSSSDLIQQGADILNGLQKIGTSP